MRNRNTSGHLASMLAVTLMLSLVLGAAPAAAQDEPVPAGDSMQETVPPEPVATDPPPPPTAPPATDPPPVATDPPPVATDPPETPPATEAPVTPDATEPSTPDGEDGVTAPTSTPDATETPEATETPTPSPTPTPTPPPPAALGLPWPYPGPIAADASGDISIIWGYMGFGVSQEYGRTAFSLAHPDWYDYGADYGLDGVSHPGLDVSMPRGTWLFSPVNGTVIVSGGSAGFSFYGNGNYGVGELRIRGDDGNEVILGHMGRIAVGVGEYVTVGQFVGVSGGFNGDHLHLETRVNMGGWFQIVDPRGSFLVSNIAAAAGTHESEGVVEPVVAEAATIAPLAPEDVAIVTGNQPHEVSLALTGDEAATEGEASPSEPAPAIESELQIQAQQAGQHVVTLLAEQAPEPAQDPAMAPDTTIDQTLEPIQQTVGAHVAILATKVTVSDTQSVVRGPVSP